MLRASQLVPDRCCLRYAWESLRARVSTLDLRRREKDEERTAVGRSLRISAKVANRGGVTPGRQVTPGGTKPPTRERLKDAERELPLVPLTHTQERCGKQRELRTSIGRVGNRRARKLLQAEDRS